MSDKQNLFPVSLKLVCMWSALYKALSHVLGQLDGNVVFIRYQDNYQKMGSRYLHVLLLVVFLFKSKGSLAGSCPSSHTDKNAGLCYQPCKRLASWAFSRGVGPICWGCVKDRPVEIAGLCYRRCPSGTPHGSSYMCYGNCPSGYRNDGLTCFRGARIFSSNNQGCPWYDKCGLTFARGCTKCPAGYKNDGCTCRRDSHLIWRPSYNRGVGVAMVSYSRGVGLAPS